MNKQLLMQKLMALEFMALDLGLFLNTHPDDCEAIKTHKELSDTAESVKAEYQKLYGPLCQFKGSQNGKWLWKDDPWPWQNQANISMRGDE